MIPSIHVKLTCSAKVVEWEFVINKCHIFGTLTSCFVHEAQCDQKKDKVDEGLEFSQFRFRMHFQYEYQVTVEKTGDHEGAVEFCLMRSYKNFLPQNLS